MVRRVEHSLWMVIDMVDWRTLLTSDPAVCDGQLCASGTRVPVTTILDSLAEGSTREQILQSYPSLKPEHVDAALAYAAELARVDGIAVPPTPEEAPELIGTDEAAKLLGIGSASTVMAWARHKLLEGFNVGGRVKVSRRSVDRLLGSEVLAREQEYERELAEVLEAFDAGDIELPPSDVSSRGRAPWDDVVTRRP